MMENTIFPQASTRVSEQTAERVNRRIRQTTARNVAAHGDGATGEIGARLKDLEREWNIERALQTNFAIVTMLGMGLGALAARRWYLFSAVAAGFMFQHALHGWCPPVPILRRLGFRTPSEIDHERMALKALRGDFADLPKEGPERSKAVLRAARG